LKIEDAQDDEAQNPEFKVDCQFMSDGKAFCVCYQSQKLCLSVF